MCNSQDSAASIEAGYQSQVWMFGCLEAIEGAPSNMLVTDQAMPTFWDLQHGGGYA